MSKEDQKSEGSKYGDESQLSFLLKAIDKRYNKNTIKAALKTLPQPPAPPTGLDDLGELTKILNTFEQAFGLELLWKELKGLGYEQSPETRETYHSGGNSVNLDEVVAWEIGGKFESSITEDKKNLSHVFSSREWQITMVENGYIRFMFKGGEDINKRLYDVYLKAGDTVSTSDSVCTINHLTEQTHVSTATYAQPQLV